MLFALGAAASAIDALSALTSSKGSTGSSTDNPFEVASPASGSTNSAAISGLGAGSQISPATMDALLAAQSQSSTGSNPSASTSASNAWQDISSQIENDAGAGDSNAAASSYNVMEQKFQQQLMSMSAPPLSFSV
jgi:hypothetical protein